jgi:hypothetical protein
MEGDAGASSGGVGYQGGVGFLAACVTARVQFVVSMCQRPQNRVLIVYANVYAFKSDINVWVYCSTTRRGCRCFRRGVRDGEALCYTCFLDCM